MHARVTGCTRPLEKIKAGKWTGEGCEKSDAAKGVGWRKMKRFWPLENSVPVHVFITQNLPSVVLRKLGCRRTLNHCLLWAELSVSLIKDSCSGRNDDWFVTWACIESLRATHRQLLSSWLGPRGWCWLNDLVLVTSCAAEQREKFGEWRMRVFLRRGFSTCR